MSVHTQQPLHTITAAETWLQVRILAALGDGLAGGVITVPGLEDRGSEELERQLMQLFARTPAVGTYIPGGEFGLHDAGQTERITGWLLCAAQNARSPGAALRGDLHYEGAWDLLARVAQAVTIRQPEANIAGCTPLRWKLAACNTQLAVCALHVQVDMVRRLPLVDWPQGWTGNDY